VPKSSLSPRPEFLNFFAIIAATLSTITRKDIMRSQILVLLDKGVEFQFKVDEAAAMAPDVARVWLDAQFTELECEPLRASGKVLTADKVLRVTEAAGEALFSNEKWAADYVRAVHAALARPMIRVDVPAMTVTY
jgi:hypothetical protein